MTSLSVSLFSPVGRLQCGIRRVPPGQANPGCKQTTDRFFVLLFVAQSWSFTVWKRSRQ